ncbi:hypothetical protein MRX96_051756 [Rhipicephalus microplus]
MRTGAEEAGGEAQRHHSREPRRASPAKSQERCHEWRSRTRSRGAQALKTLVKSPSNAKAGSQACADRAPASVAVIATPLLWPPSPQKLSKGDAGKGGPPPPPPRLESHLKEELRSFCRWALATSAVSGVSGQSSRLSRLASADAGCVDCAWRWRCRCCRARLASHCSVPAFALA